MTTNGGKHGSNQGNGGEGGGKIRRRGKERKVPIENGFGKGKNWKGGGKGGTARGGGN